VNKHWDRISRYLLILLTLYILPSLLEIVVGILNLSNRCDAPLVPWMFIDAIFSILWTIAYAYGQVSLHNGLDDDPELKDYIVHSGSQVIEPEDVDRLELKYSLLRRKTSCLPRMCYPAPILVSMCGLALLLVAGSSSECDDVVRAWTLWMALAKVFTPILIACLYGLLFFLVIAGVIGSDEDEDEPQRRNEKAIELSKPGDHV